MSSECHQTEVKKTRRSQQRRTRKDVTDVVREARKKQLSFPFLGGELKDEPQQLAMGQTERALRLLHMGRWIHQGLNAGDFSGAEGTKPTGPHLGEDW